jgi:hypothetical protein
MIENFIFTPISKTTEGVKLALQNGTALITNRELFSIDWNNFNEIVPGIFVDKDLINDFTPEYFNTSIVGKKAAAPHNALYIGLPCNNKIKVYEPDVEFYGKDNTLYRESNLVYHKIDFDTETTIGELYKNAWKYSYTKTWYSKLSEKKSLQQLLKPLLAKKIFRLYGYPSDRLADYGRIILFLLSKVSLTDDERDKLSVLLDNAPSIDDISDVIDRESGLQSFVNKVKEDPLTFLNNGFVD